jgi:hypothetical protein
MLIYLDDLSDADLTVLLLDVDNSVRSMEPRGPLSSAGSPKGFVMKTLELPNGGHAVSFHSDYPGPEFLPDKLR